MAKKLLFTHLGCFRNLVDSELMISRLKEAGYELTVNVKEADLIVVNTCGFLREARQEAILEFKILFGKKKKKARVIAAGCMVPHHRRELAQFPIDAFVGSGDIDRILDAAMEMEEKEYVSESRSFLEKPGMSRFQITGAGYTFLKIAEGCRKACSYCIIPKIKGPLKSKKIDDIILEMQSLLAKGNFEINLIAQDLADFGKDRGKGELLKLLKEISNLKENFWLRLLYLYPDDLEDGIIEVISSDARFCHYLDMPLQHVSDSVLKRMGRNITKERIIFAIRKIRKRIPDIAFRTSFMVGFPGETEEEFAELLNFVKTFKLDQVGIFKYSNEELAKSFSFEGQIPEKIKERRYQKLALLQQKIHEEKSLAMVGRTMEVLVTGYHPDSELLAIARSAYQCPDVDSKVIINDISKIKHFGSLLPVKITATLGQDLLAVPL